MPLRSSLMRSAAKLFRVFDDEDLDLRGKTLEYNFIPTPPSELSGGTAFPSTPASYIRFQSPGTFEVAGSPCTVDILVIGGGGGGGSFNPGAYAGGGGGGGGVRWCPGIALAVGTYPVVVGDGGTGDGPGGNAPSPPYDGGPPAQPKGGGTSSIFNPGDGNSVPAITATGGGAGGFAGDSGQGDGGSGGGCSYSPGGSEADGNLGGDEPRANPVKEGGPSFPTQRGPQPSGGCCGGGGAGDVDGLSPLPRQNGVAGHTIPQMGSPGDPWLPPAGNVFSGGGGGASYKSQGGLGEGGPGGGADAANAGNDAADYSGGGGGGGGKYGGGDGGHGVIYIVTTPANPVSPA